jgi:predicted metalloprotease with PDZ domain
MHGAIAHRYLVDLSRARDHLIDLTLTVTVPDGAEHLDLTLPAWCPGSYLIRDYARFVRDLEARGEDGDRRHASKVDKSTWRVVTAGARTLTVRYAVYGHDLTVRTNHVDASHAFVHGPATFLYAPALRDRPVAVDITAPEAWTLATGMAEREPAGPGRHRLTAGSIDELYDQPLHLGQVEVRTFAAAEVPFSLVVWGPLAPGPFGLDDLVRDLGAIAAAHITRIGAAPFARYTFVLMLTADGYGGLEHGNSSINLFHPQALTSRKHYEGLLELLSHELFHAWNGKRIAPAPLLAFDYGREAYTRSLWLMEGLTSHYDRWGLRDARDITAKSYLDKVLDDWSRLVAVPGRRRHSLEDSSFDAWIKLYKPDESNLNTTVSYYLKGGLVMFALDLHLRRVSGGARCLDDVLRALWRDWGARGRPHPEALAPVFAEATGIDLDGLFAAQIQGTADPDLAGELAAVGLELRPGHDGALTADGNLPVWMGLVLAGGRVSAVYDDGPGQAAGVAPGDELVAIDRARASTDAEARAQLAGRRPGQDLELHCFRRGRLVSTTLTLAAAPPTRWEIVVAAEPGPGAARYQAWMGEPLPPPATVLASVTTTSRSI